VGVGVGVGRWGRGEGRGEGEVGWPGGRGGGFITVWVVAGWGVGVMGGGWGSGGEASV
jgi:hypothetical protein